MTTPKAPPMSDEPETRALIEKADKALLSMNDGPDRELVLDLVAALEAQLAAAPRAGVVAGQDASFVRRALNDAGKQFREYERRHLAKGTPEGADKVFTNACRALTCEAAMLVFDRLTIAPPAVPDPDESTRIAIWMTARGYATGHGDSIEDMLAELTANVFQRASSGPDPRADLVAPFSPTHRHIKRGTEYQFIDEADLQTDKPLSDYEVVSVYRGNDGRVWVRPSSEFNDGRFERLPGRDGGAG